MTVEPTDPAFAARDAGTPHVRYIRIVATPPGEAPEAIRRAWIGVEIPVDDGYARGPKPLIGFGVLTRPRTLMGQLWATVRGRAIKWTGYCANGGDAVDALEQRNPEAAAWWRANAAWVLDGMLAFPTEACLLLDPDEAGDDA